VYVVARLAFFIVLFVLWHALISPLFDS
jgi:hypothetical protein